MTLALRGLFAAAVLLQLVVLYLPVAPGDGAGLGWEHTDKVVHVVVFAAVAWAGRAIGLRTGALVAVLLVHAGLSELIQHLFLPSRSGDLGDVVADVAGVALGACLPVRGRGTRAPDRDGAPPVGARS